MHHKRRDNHDRYLMAARVKGLVKKKSDQEGVSEDQVRQQLLKGYEKMFKGNES